MAKLTRRTFLTRTSASAAGAATLGVVAGALGVAAGNHLSDGPAAKLSTAALSEPLVVYVRDASKGEVAFLMGMREITRRDPALVARLLNAAM